MKVYINGQGHITKMAAMAINSKNIDDLDLFYGKVNLGLPCIGMGKKGKCN